jgi:hypothetical protein
VSFFPVSYQNYIWLDSPIGGKHHWAVAWTFAGLNAFGDVALAVHW